MQLGLAVESKNATLPVKRRLACEQLSYLGQVCICVAKSYEPTNCKTSISKFPQPLKFSIHYLSLMFRVLVASMALTIKFVQNFTWPDSNSVQIV